MRNNRAAIVLLGILVLMMLFSGVFESLGGVVKSIAQAVFIATAFLLIVVRLRGWRNISRIGQSGMPAARRANPESTPAMTTARNAHASDDAPIYVQSADRRTGAADLLTEYDIAMSSPSAWAHLQAEEARAEAREQEFREKEEAAWAAVEEQCEAKEQREQAEAEYAAWKRAEDERLRDEQRERWRRKYEPDDEG